MRIKTACVALVMTVSAPVLAEDPQPAPTAVPSATEIPTHVVRDIRRFVEPAEVIIIGSIQKVPENGKVSVKVDQTIAGVIPSEIELATDGIYEPDYEVGAKLLLSLRKMKAKNRWAVTGAYERVFEGNVREYTLDSFLAVVTREHGRVQKERKSLAVTSSAAPTSTVANASEPH
jgi:hypothetical protein